MKIIFFTLLISLSSMIANASSTNSKPQESFYPSYCSNYGDKVSYSFTSCVNSNFNRLEFEIDGIFLNHCSNFGDDLSFSFESCVNRNFDTVSRELGMYLSYCMNIGRGVSYSFISCINRNMNEISYQLRR